MSQSLLPVASGRSAELRIAVRNASPCNPGGAYVLYWMTANRRTRANFALERALSIARHIGRPLLVLEALRCDYPHASDRVHRFVIDGMAAQRDRFVAAGITYYPYVEPARGAARGLLERLAEDACVVVTDDSPLCFLQRMLDATAPRLAVHVEAVDSYGLLPRAAADRCFPSAYGFRRFLHEALPAHLAEMPCPDPLAEFGGSGTDGATTFSQPRAAIAADVLSRWPRAHDELLDGLGNGAGGNDVLSLLPIDHSVAPTLTRGGATAAAEVLNAFVADALPRFDTDRSDPDASAASGLSPYLHFGHVGAHEVFARIAAAEGWSLTATARRAMGKKAGWWGMSPAAEAFIDQVVTWRELGANFCRHHPGQADRYESLPPWALATLDKHRTDVRKHLYTRAELESAATHDEVWNAAQRQLVSEGRIQNYLRMLWGKKVIEWSQTPEEAAETLVLLNDKYALDGRDPNSYSGIFWCFGRYDRPWGPERSVFGTVRYMSSDAARRKLDMESYLRRWSVRPTEPVLAAPLQGEISWS